MMFSFKHLLSSTQLTVSHVEDLIEKTDEYYEKRNERNCKDLAGRILATLFFEASTRTRFSFESAMYRLGGHVVSLEQGLSSSVKKGESLSDMGRMMSHYADIVVIRHPDIGSVDSFSKYATIPIINAGDGSNQHPTQSLVDLYTIYKEKGTLSNLKIGFLGDLKYSRTVRSLVSLLKQYSSTFSFISHESLMISDALRHELLDTGSSFVETFDLKTVLADLDILYVTRVQKERFESKELYEMVKNKYFLKEEDVYKIPHLTILHPLPKINEIDKSVDFLSHAKYFKQAEYGVYVRMALLNAMCY
jgi:aspartate carbamoyltransferase catalytic subunit